MLEQERAFYAEQLHAWLNLYPGRIVLVKDDHLIGVYDTVDQALAEGARRFGLAPFLVRRVESEQSEIHVPALTLGLLRANTSRSV